MPFVPDQTAGRFVPDQAKPSGFVPDAAAAPAPAEHRTVFGNVGDVNIPGTAYTFQDALGLLEQPGAGAYGLVNQAQAGVRALFNASVYATAGKNFGDIFSEEYNQATQDMPDYVPLTPSGAKLQETMSTAMEAGLKAYGGSSYELGRPIMGPSDIADLAVKRATDTTVNSPAAGALAEAVATLLGLAAPIPGLGKGKAALVDPIAKFEKAYPVSAAALDASRIGKITIEPTQLVMDAVDKALASELDISLEGLSTGDKLKAVIQKYAPDLPPNEQVKVANAYVARFQETAARQQEVMDARPKLPAPAPVEGEVLPPEVIIAEDGTKTIPKALPAPGETSVGTSDANAIQVDSSGNAMTAKQVQTQSAAYASQWKKYQAWQAEEESTLSGKTKGIKSNQGGSIEIEGLQFNIPEGIKTLEEATAKGVIAQYQLNKNEISFFKNMDYQTWEDFTNHVPSAKLQGNNVLLDAKDIPRLKQIIDYVNSPYNVNPTGGIAKEGVAGGKQKGSIEIQGLEQNIPEAAKVVKQVAGKSWALADPQAAASAADRALEAGYKTMAEKGKIFSVETIKAARRMIVSHDFDLQGDLKRAGPLGNKAMLEMNIEHNATMAAKARYDKAGRQIFDDLSPAETKALEKVVRLRRIVEIDKNKGVGTVKHEIDPVTKQSITGPMANALLDQLKNATGKTFEKIDAKATAIFTQERVNLHRLLDEGLINPDTFLKAQELDYTLPEYLNVIDPKISVESRGSSEMLPASGIPYRAKASMTMDAKLALQENIARVENRISKNKTKLALYDLAIAKPDNGIVQVGSKAKADKGWTKMSLMLDGEEKSLLMKDNYAAQFSGRPDVLGAVHLGDTDVTLATIFRTASGSSLLRYTATVAHPEFILAGLPMDILHLWLATAKQYSAFLPKYAFQVSADLAATAKDAFFRTGRWEQAMMEGMGPNFLTHEGRLSASVGSVMEPRMQKIRTALSYLGDFQDMWVRLAHRERLIKQGYDARTATAMAVERLNYYRGGVMTKMIDTVVPYVNISVNATSKVIEVSAKNKLEAFAKVGQMVGVFGAVKLANMIMSPETDKAISPEDKVRNLQVTFGDQMFVIDPDGQKRYMYANIRIDQTGMPFNAAVVAGLENAEYGKVPDSITSKAIGQVNPLSSMFPPTWQAYRAYVDNYDPRRDSPIYNGLKVKPEDEIRNMSKNNPTSALAKFVGQTTGLSPMGLQAAAGALVNTNNTYLQAAGASLKIIFQGMDPREQAQDSTQYALEKVPFLRSVIKLTTPGLSEMKDLEKITLESNSKYKNQIDGLEEMLFKVTHKQAGEKEVETYIKAQPPEAQKTLADHYKYEFKVDAVLRKGEVGATEGIPARNWWITSAKIRDEARAQIFYNKWISADSGDRRRMLGIANALQQQGVGYMSQSFQREFQKQVQLLGTERR